MKTRRAFLASLAAAAAGCKAEQLVGPPGPPGPAGPPGPPAPPPPPPPPPVSGSIRHLSEFGVKWQGDETPLVQAAMTEVATFGGSLDFEGRAITVHAPLIVPPTTQLIGQQRGLKILNAMDGIIAAGDFPIFQAAPNLLVLFFSLESVQLMGIQPSRVAPLVDYQGMSHFTFRDVWAFAPNGDGFSAIGNYQGSAPYYGTWAGGLMGCRRGIVAASLGQPSTGPNSNSVRGVTFSGCGVGVEIGQHCQNWIIGDDQFEGCAVGVKAHGTRMLIEDGNRFEGAGPGAVGIQLGPDSDGKVGRQYRSIDKLILADPTLDLANWVIDAQPENQ